MLDQNCYKYVFVLVLTYTTKLLSFLYVLVFSQIPTITLVIFFFFEKRLCICINHKDLEKLCAIAFCIVTATHKEECNCQSAFCDICHALDYTSIFG